MFILTELFVATLCGCGLSAACVYAGVQIRSAMRTKVWVTTETQISTPQE